MGRRRKGDQEYRVYFVQFGTPEQNAAAEKRLIELLASLLDDPPGASDDGATRALSIQLERGDMKAILEGLGLLLDSLLESVPKDEHTSRRGELAIQRGVRRTQ